MTVNVDGLSLYRFKGKIKFSDITQTENVAIFSLAESHLTVNIKEAETRIKYHTHFKTDRYNQRKKGGAITYEKNNLTVKVLFQECNSYTEAEMIYINIYRPPAYPTSKFIEPLTR